MMINNRVKIDKNSPIPIYHQLKEGFVELIESGELQMGALLPSENQLSQHYQISSMTVRQAMKALADEGYIHRERGKGTYVAHRPLKHQLTGVVGFSQDMLRRNMKPGSELLRLESVLPPADVLERAGLAAGTHLTLLSRIRLADGMPVGIHHSYLHNVMFDAAELEAYGSLYTLLEAKGIVLDEGEETLEATIATAKEATMLHIPEGFPLLKARRFCWDVNGNFVEYVVALYHADFYQYTIRLKR
jgi:GntR family transcriptional regulator